MGHKPFRREPPPPAKDQAPEKHPAQDAPPAEAEAARLERLQDEVRELNDQRLRMLADLDNTKKRLQREREEFSRFAAETLIRQLLPILDSLDQALVAVDKQADADAVVKGVHLIHRQLLGVLHKEGVARIPTVGEPFDPHRHEAVGRVEAADGAADNTIVEDVQVGYTMHDKVLRPALVKVATRPAQAQEETSNG